MQLRTRIRPCPSSALALGLLAGPAYAQEDDDAVEATQEELDAVGGSRGKEKAPHLSQSIQRPPQPKRPQDTSSSANDSLGDATNPNNDGVYGNPHLDSPSAMTTPGFNTDFCVRDDSLPEYSQF